MSQPSSNSIAASLIEDIEAKYNAKFNEKSKTYWAKELEIYSKDELKQAFRLFKKEYLALPYMFSVSEALIRQLKPTFTIATIEERLFTSIEADNPNAFLASLSPKLEKLAREGGFFERQQTMVDRRFAANAIAKRFIEWHQNKEKGFERPEPKKKQIECRPELVRSKNPFAGLSVGEAAQLALDKLKSSGSCPDLVEAYEKRGDKNAA